MLLVSLDESGRFEQIRGTRPGCMFISGAVFICDSEAQINNELRRLESLFRLVCEEQGAEYPADLHYNRDGRGMVINAEKASRVKSALAQELPRFFNGTERWAGNKPAGTYGLYAMLGDSRGMESPGEAPSSNLLNDDVAANRYEHMAYRAIENLLFYDQKLENEKDVRLDLATRVIRVPDSIELQQDIELLGYRRRRNEDGTFDVSTRIVTDEGSFRASLQSAAERVGCYDMQFNLNVQSINYNAPQHHQGFLYLADTVCSVFQDVIAETPEIGRAFEKLFEYCSNTVGRKMTMLWAYKPIDRLYRSALNCLKQADYFGTALDICEARNSANKLLALVYDRLWLAYMVKTMEAVKTPFELQLALDKLDEYLHSRGYSLVYAAAIFDTLKAAVDGLEPSARKGKLLFRLAVIQMTISNHQGNPQKATESYNDCLKYAQFTTVEEFLGLQNTRSVTLIDEQRIDEALVIAKEAASSYEMLGEIRKDIYAEHSPFFVSYGRTLSQVGQCYAFLSQNNEAIAMFKEALKHFPEDLGDKQRTISYLLHVAIENGDAALFGEYVESYLGMPDILQWCKDKRPLPDNGGKFSLFVYVKALYVFYRASLNRKNILSLTNTVKQLYERRKDGHPWELILKYCALLLADKNDTESEEQYEWFKNEISVSVNAKGSDILTQIVQDSQAHCEYIKKGNSEPFASSLTYFYH